jgi:hypothetical protein
VGCSSTEAEVWRKGHAACVRYWESKTFQSAPSGGNLTSSVDPPNGRRPAKRVTNDAPDDNQDVTEPDFGREVPREAEELEDGSLDPDELTGEPEWWDEGSDDET